MGDLLSSRQHLIHMLSQVEPFDEIEKYHQREAIAFFQNSPYVPNALKRHQLVLDRPRQQLWLLDHEQTGKWCSPGLEHGSQEDTPFFLAESEPGAFAAWHIRPVEQLTELSYNPREYRSAHWFRPHEIMMLDGHKVDLSMYRLAQKVQRDMFPGG